MTKAFQDHMPGNHCFGCGPENEQGLAIKSHWESDTTALCLFNPKAHHAAGPKTVLNGGIIATIIDCHGVCTALAHAYKLEGRELGSSPLLWYVTGKLSVQYLKPTPIDQELQLRAEVIEVKGKKTMVKCELKAGGDVCATGDVLAIRVPKGWTA